MAYLANKNVDAIVIHCTASREGVDLHASDIDKMHKDKGWAGIGYHYVITLDGKIEKGRPVNQVGAHANTKGLSGKPYNYHSVGIAYVGGLDKKGNPKDTRTPKQKEAMHKLVFQLLDEFPNIKEIIGHRDTSPDKNGNGKIDRNEWIKQCPCFEVRAEFPIAIITAERSKKK